MRGTTTQRPATGTEQMTVDQLCAELQVARSTFYQWRQVGRGPRCVRLPNGAIRVRRSDLEEWLAGLVDVA